MGKERSFSRLIWRLEIATIVMFLLGLLVAVFAYIANDHRTEEGRQARQALCVLRHDRENDLAVSRRRLATSQAFLREHPNGVDGIPRALIVKGVADARQEIETHEETLAALDLLHCPRVPK
jgi:hypothetical protein